MSTSILPRRLPIVPSVRPKSPLNSDGTREQVIVADVRGRFHRVRRMSFVVMFMLGVALPWIKVGGRPALFIDVPQRNFFLFGLTLTAQDSWVFLLLLLSTALAMVTVTALAGRAFCGFVCPQTVLLDGIFRHIDRWFLGSRDARLRMKRQGWSGQRVARTVAAYLGYWLVSVALAHVLAMYFVTPRALLLMVREGPRASLQAFGWVTAFTLLLFLDGAWFREQLCLIVCPYGRLQSLMLDEQSLVVGYDERRGEPRGKTSVAGAGDCVDCGRCVAVCPTGIDIRNGLQLDCIGCTACIDACDEIMTKLDRPVGLVRFDSLRGLAGAPWRLLRRRTVGYAALTVLTMVVTAFCLRARNGYEAHILRMAGAPYVLENGTVRNAFQVHLVNKRATSELFRIEAEPRPAVTYTIPLAEVTLAPFGDTALPVFASLPAADSSGAFRVRLHIKRAGAAAESVSVDAPFLGPGR